MSVLLLALRWTNEKKMRKNFITKPVGNTVTFRCRAAGEPPLTARWYKNGELITKNMRMGDYRVSVFNFFKAI